MYRLRVLDAKTVRTEGLMEMIVELNEHNEQPLTAQMNRRNVTADEIFILVLTETNRLAGYMQCRVCYDGGDRSVSSMQIDRRHGQSILISQLLLGAKKDLLQYRQSIEH